MMSSPQAARLGPDTDQDVHITQDDVVRFLKRGFLLATVAAALAATAMYLYQSDAQPVYEADTTIYAADNVVDLRSVGLSYLVSPALHVDAYEVAALSQEVLLNALSELGEMDPSPDDVEVLKRRVSVTTNQDSRLIVVTAAASEPEIAMQRSESVARALVDWDAQRPRDNLLRMIDGLRQRIASLDVQLSGLEPGPQRDSLVALRGEQVSQLATAVMLSDSVVGRLEIVQPPAMPESPVAPSPVFDAVIAAAVAFVLAYFTKLMLAIFDSRLRDVTQVQAATGLPVLATFPPVGRGQESRLHPVATGFLRSALVPAPGGATAVLLTGAQRSSPASRLALGLAESFARGGSGTLLVSTLPGDPVLFERMGESPPEESTLEAHLRNPRAALTLYHLRVEGAGVLALLPSWDRSADASELITFGLRDALARWRQEYDVVIVVTPSIQAAADAVTVAPMVDRIVLVAERGVGRRDLFTAAELLRQRGIEGAGVVVTDVRGARAVEQGALKGSNRPQPTRRASRPTPAK